MYKCKRCGKEFCNDSTPDEIEGTVTLKFEIDIPIKGAVCRDIESCNIVRGLVTKTIKDAE